MTLEEEKYYEHFFQMFRSEGWKQLVEEMSEMLNAVDSIAAAKDNEDLWFRKGQLLVLTNFIALEDTLRRGYEDAQGDYNETDV